MKARLFLLLLAAAVGFAPGLRAEPRVAQSTDEVDAVDAEFAAFGRWLTQFGQIQAGLQTSLRQLDPAWREVLASDDRAAAIARFRGLIVRILQDVDRTNATIEALDRPEFPALELDADLRPASMVSQAVALNRSLRAAILEYDAVIDALQRHDPGAGAAANERMMQAFGLVIDGQIVAIRASLAVTPRDDPTWEMVGVELAFMRATRRLLAAWPALAARGDDPGLPRDLAALATELETLANAGSDRLEAAIAEHGAARAEADRAGDAGTANVLRRVLAVLDVDRAVFALARDLATLLRAHSATLGDRLDAEALAQAMRDLWPIRSRMDQIVIDEGNAAAQTR